MIEKTPVPVPEGKSEGEKVTRRDFLINASKLFAGGVLSTRGILPKKTHEAAPGDADSGIKSEELMQGSYYDEYAKKYSVSYGERLYQKTELADPNFSPASPRNFKLIPRVRLLQYFLRSGRDETFRMAEKLGCKYHETVLDDSHPLTALYVAADMDIRGESISWLEVPEGRSGELRRDGSKYGGKTESVMIVKAYDGKLDNWVMTPAQKAGYRVVGKDEFDGLVANEMTHEIQYKYFPSLFNEHDQERLDEPFRSFTTEVPGLAFRHNFQAAEFLSDVSHWIVAGRHGAYYRFFNPLFYMDPDGEYYKKANIIPAEDNYWYSYQVQKYAMEQVLKQKGYKDSKAVVDSLIQKAGKSNYDNHHELFVVARKHFKEDDFEKIAELYRRIGIALLKKMKSYYSKPK